MNSLCLLVPFSGFIAQFLPDKESIELLLCASTEFVRGNLAGGKVQRARRRLGGSLRDCICRGLNVAHLFDEDLLVHAHLQIDATEWLYETYTKH